MYKHSITMRIVYVTLAIPLLLALSGCGRLDRFLDQLDNVIDEFAEARRAILADSQSWKVHLEELIDHTDGKVRTLIEDGTLGHLIDHAAGATSDEIKSLLVQVEKKVLGYLNGVIKALKEKRLEIKQNGGVPSDTIEDIIAEIIASVDDVEPFIGRTSLKRLSYVSKSGAKILQKTKANVELRGFGFRNRKIEIVGVNSAEKIVWKADRRAVVQNTDFVVTFDPGLAGPLPRDVVRIDIRWETSRLASLALSEVEKTAPQALLKSARIGFIGEEKYPFVAFDVELGIYDSNGKRPIARTKLAGADRLWNRNGLYNFPMQVLDQHPKLTHTETLYLEISMSRRHGGKVIEEYTVVRNPSFGAIAQFYSKKSKPKWVYKKTDLLKRGFVLEPKRKKSYIRSNPSTIFRNDWKGRVRIALNYGGKQIEFDESPEFEFDEGKNRKGSYIQQFRWGGNGLSKN